MLKISQVILASYIKRCLIHILCLLLEDAALGLLGFVIWLRSRGGGTLFISSLIRIQPLSGHGGTVLQSSPCE